MVVMRDENFGKKISIITVCFNSADTIEHTIISVINQSYKNIEYIIIDGGSTDGTLEIIRKYEEYISYWVSEPDKGIYDAMNKGIKAATGEIIAFINSDDWYADGAVKTVVEKFRETNADAVHAIVKLVKNGNIVGEFGRNPKLEDFFCKMVIPHPATFVRASVVKEELFDTSYKIAADYDLLLKL